MSSEEYKKKKYITIESEQRAKDNVKRRKKIFENSDIAIDTSLRSLEEQKKFVETAIKEKMRTDPKMESQETLFVMKELMKLYKDICDSQMNVIAKSTSKETARVSAKKAIVKKKPATKEEQILEEREELKGFLSNMNFTNKA